MNSLLTIELGCFRQSCINARLVLLSALKSFQPKGGYSLCTPFYYLLNAKTVVTSTTESFFIFIEKVARLLVRMTMNINHKVTQITVDFLKLFFFFLNLLFLWKLFALLWKINSLFYEDINHSKKFYFISWSVSERNSLRRISRSFGK